MRRPREGKVKQLILAHRLAAAARAGELTDLQRWHFDRFVQQGRITNSEAIEAARRPAENPLETGREAT
jgi:hypothetical protein